MMRKQDKWAVLASPVNVSRMCLKASKPTGPVSDSFIRGEGGGGGAGAGKRPLIWLLIWPKRVCTVEQGMVFKV